MVERTLVRFLTTWEAEVKFETSEPCPAPPGGLWDRAEDSTDIRLVFFNRADIFRLQLPGRVVVSEAEVKESLSTRCPIPYFVHFPRHSRPYRYITHIVISLRDSAGTHTVHP